MTKYPKYKDSGVKWIGDVPEHWELRSIKYVAKFNPNKTRTFFAAAVVGYAPMDKIKNGYMISDTIEVGKISSGLTYFENGDVVMAKVTPCFENGNIAIAKDLVNGCAYGSSELFVFRPTGIDSKYFFTTDRLKS
jgi:hypothetical protein